MSLDAIVSVSWWMIVPLIGIGSALHFAFDWSGHNRVFAVFSAVNESYWEHIKIAVWPVAALHLVLFAAGGFRIPAFIPAATIALYTIPVGMVGLVFAYKNLVRRNMLWLDIASFAIVIAAAQTVFVLILTELAAGAGTITLSAVFLLGLVIAFLKFTLRPPHEPDVFIDPLTGRYGLSAHPDLDRPDS